MFVSSYTASKSKPLVSLARLGAGRAILRFAVLNHHL